MKQYKKNSLNVRGAVALGTGVMIGAGIFALLGQVAELAGQWFPYIFLLGALVSAFSAYSYIKVSNAYPSAGGIAMILTKAYGKTTVAASASVLMALSMIINESLVARTFGSYTLQLFSLENDSIWGPALGVALLIFAFLINLSGNKIIGKTSQVMSFVKIAGIIIFAATGLAVSRFTITDLLPLTDPADSLSAFDYMGAVALAILAYKGFTTITNSGSEIINPHKNVGKSIIISLLICTVVYFFVAIAVSSNLTISEIVAAKDYSLAEAAKPAFGNYGLYLTVALAIIATISGIIASIFAVSRMTAMLTDMQLIPDSHLNIFAKTQKNMLLFIVAFAIVLTIFFDLSRIASLGAIFYLVMDMIVHWGVLTRLRKKVEANRFILMAALLLDLLVLIAFIRVKFRSDLFVVIFSLILIILIFAAEKWFLSMHSKQRD
jgi:amino acid transporter